MKTDSIKSFRDDFETIVKEVEKQIVGQNKIVKNLLIGIIAGGNVLMEGVPGLGKTVLVKTFAKVMDLPFSRIQFTPDLMPTDIIGTEIVNKTDGDITFCFQKGPIFSSLILADEINRATPKTQSALLEAMQEKTVSVGRKIYHLQEPFFVLATQNPLEMEGTYPLPEAQLDRFMFKLHITLPEKEDIFRIMDITVGGLQKPVIEKQITRERLLEMKEIAMKVPIASNVKEKAVRIMLETHPDRTNIKMVKEYVRCGVSIRGIQSVIAGAKVKALSEGRFHVSFEDIYDMAVISMRHRIFLNFKAMADKIEVDYIIREILKKVK
ncbi:AAA family ATPase [Caminicella sporogenes]|uniref:AAA family ATPase n=1 Tax=Caminicella sporogenes TaxID=166485 RepID=UPI0025411682|nr:AAA family ATPase [Caminicella sporogenes]WIF95429.1 AAA family ATPase [Caminicella sporogenes]